MASYRVDFSRSAAKELRKIDKKWIPKLVEAAEALGTDPRPNGCKKLVGSDHTYRIRVGDFRIVYDIQDTALVVLVVRVRSRGGAYR